MVDLVLTSKAICVNYKSLLFCSVLPLALESRIKPFFGIFAEVLKELLQSFPNLVMTTDSSNSTALHTAAAQGHIDAVNLLLETDSNLAKIARNNGKTVLHTAARMGHFEVVKSLLRKDSGIGFRPDKKGQTALHMAVKGQSVEIVLELGKPDPAVLNLEDNKGNTALHIATGKGKAEVFFTFTPSLLLLHYILFVRCALHIAIGSTFPPTLGFLMHSM